MLRSLLLVSNMPVDVCIDVESNAVNEQGNVPDCIGCEVILKATKVDGVYDSDPVTNPKAKKFKSLTHMEVINKNLGVMDATAISLCMDNGLPVVVFNLLRKGNVKRVVMGQKIGTRVDVD